MFDTVEIMTLAAAVVAGVVLGGFYFGGLWWTVRRMPEVLTSAESVLHQPGCSPGGRPGRLLWGAHALWLAPDGGVDRRLGGEPHGADSLPWAGWSG